MDDEAETPPRGQTPPQPAAPHGSAAAPEPELELFWLSGSPFSWRVMLALLLKELPYRSHRLEMQRGELRAPAFLSVNPRGRVPALRHGAVTVRESVACLAYLDRIAPDRPLFGADAAAAGRIWPLVMECVAYLDRPVDDVILPFYFGGAEERRPRITADLAAVDEELGWLERELARRGPFLAGTAAPTAADCVVYPLLRSLQRAASKPAAATFAFAFLPLEAARPALGAWMARMEALPGFAGTVPPHWT